MKKIILLCSLILLFYCSKLFSQDSLSQPFKDILQLTSREFAGRGFMLGGHKKAAQYIKDRFKEIGLSPLNNSYGQEFQVEQNIIESVPSLSINGISMQLGKDFLPLATSGSGEAKDLPVFYINSGLFIKEKNINDYSNINQEGSILIVDEEIPSSIQNDKSIDPRAYSKEMRIEIAKILKASAIIFLVKKLSYSTPHMRNEIPIFDLLKTSLIIPAERISFNVETTSDDYDGENIIGKLDGTANNDSTIIFCAHYDHLGGFSDSLFFPGANDNASGVSILLELASYFKQNSPKHTIFFITFYAEEVGLVGSKYFAEHPLFPLERTMFLLNLDMVASGDDGIMAVGGDNHPEFYNILKSVNNSLAIAPLYKRPTAPNGDHYFISQKGVKTFFLYTNKGNQPYHSVNDIPETLDWKAFNHVLKLSKAFINEIDKR